MEKSREDRAAGSLEIPRVEPRVKSRRLRYDEKLSALDQLDPPLTKEERKAVFEQRESAEVERRIEKVVEEQNAQQTSEVATSRSEREPPPVISD
jgi:hypothetical protein